MNDFENATLDDDDDANEVVMKWRHDWKQLFSRGEIANKTIQIAPMRYYAPCRRQHYFYDIFVLRQYGEVESANIQFENDAIICGLVQYRDSKIASNLVDRGQIFIRNIEYKVKPMNALYTSVGMIECLEKLKLNELKSEPFTQDTQNNIITVLNDDCLRETFRKFDKLSDFHSIANVCKQFNRIAKEVFSSEIKYETVCFLNIMHPGYEVTLFQIVNFLSNFGSSIFHIEITDDLFEKIPDASNSLFKLIFKHCKNLRKLNLFSQSIRKECLLDIFPILSQLECLEVDLSCQSDMDLLNDIWIYCTQLKFLRISGYHCPQYNLPAINFPKLIKFRVYIRNISCQEFLERNPQIEDLIIPYSSKLAELIVKKLPNIRKLSLRVDENVFTEIDCVYLRRLEHVYLHMVFHINDSLMNLFAFPMKNITTLALHAPANFDQNLLIELTKNLHGLEKLTIRSDEYEYVEPTNNITTATLKEMLHFANQLSELSIFCTNNFIYYFDESDYYNILENIKKRINHINLKVNIQCNATQIVYSALDSSASINRLKVIDFNMDPKWLSVSVLYKYD
ncbi:uncharacterized protein LOC116337280 isoform X2 [Contarinia nasturtii]|nr:uncharacterized protein LOC116337280 isoform X2 [Contarinia nasturtii]XP_031617567.1 uncharacterized protein LOC116337280 isoform X2 [Contarinia nasturtii]